MISDEDSGHTHKEGWAELIALKIFLPPTHLKQVTHHSCSRSYKLILPKGVQMGCNMGRGKSPVHEHLTDHYSELVCFLLSPLISQ